MAADAVQFDQCCIVTGCAKAFGKIPLLLYWKENIGLYSYDECTLKPQMFESGLERTTVLGEIEQIRCPRQIQVAIRIEGTAEFVRMVLEIHFDRESDFKRIVDVLFRCCRSLAAKALNPFLG